MKRTWGAFGFDPQQICFGPFDDGGGGDGDRGQDRGADRGGDRSQDRGSDRGQQRGGDRSGDRQQQQQRTSDRGGDRSQDRGQDRGGDSVFDLRDDARVRLTDGRVVTAKQYRDEVAAASEKEVGGRYSKARDMILKEAQRLEGLQRNNRGGDRNQPPADPFADVRSMSVVDGQTLANLAAQLRDNGLAPIANLVTQMHQRMGAMQKQLTEYGGHVGTVNEERASQEFENTLTRDLGELEVKGLEGRAIDPQNPALREIARNLFLSYEPSSWKPGEFKKMLQDQLSSVVGMVRAMDKKAVELGREKARSFFNPAKRAGNPSGQPREGFKSAGQIAAMARESGFFDSRNAT